MDDVTTTRRSYSAPEAGERTGLGTAIYDKLQRKTIPGWREGRAWRVDADAVDRLAGMSPDARRLTLGHLPRQLGAARLQLLQAVALVDRLLLALVAATSTQINNESSDL